MLKTVKTCRAIRAVRTQVRRVGVDQIALAGLGDRLSEVDTLHAPG